jgi:CheY-like chemotaxis protein
MPRSRFPLLDHHDDHEHTMTRQLANAAKRAVILLAEDDPGDQELTRRALADDASHVDLRVVGDGEEAMDYLLRRRDFAEPRSSPTPDLILLDLNMPRVNGFEVLEQLRAHSQLDRIPVVVLTTSRHHEDIVRSYDLGCNSFIAKPLAIGPFIEVVRSLGHYWFDLVNLPTGAGAGAR